MIRRIVTVKDPTLGKGWYTEYVDLPNDATDEQIYNAVKTQFRTAIAVRITREYNIKVPAWKSLNVNP